LLEERLALIPGEAFGVKGFVRLSFSASIPNLVKGIQILKKFCEKY